MILNKIAVKSFCAILLTLLFVCSFGAVIESVPGVDASSADILSHNAILQTTHVSFNVVTEDVQSISESREDVVNDASRLPRSSFGRIISILLHLITFVIINLLVSCAIPIFSKDNHVITLSYIQESDGKKQI